MQQKDLPWNIQLARNWQRILPPARPSSSELKIYKKYLKPMLRIKKPRVLILGSTPEFRDLLLKFR